MSEVIEVLQREFVYVWYYFTLQPRQIAGYWILGMVVGSLVSVFMLTGPSTKITNLGALKIMLGMKWFLLYLAFVMAVSLLMGLIVNLVI